MTRYLTLLFFVLGAATHAFAAIAPEQLAAAKALFDQQLNDEARVAFAKLAATDAQNAEVPHYQGLLALRTDDPASAIQYLERAVALAPKSSESFLRLGDAYGTQAHRAGIFSKLGLAKKCLHAYESAVATDPRNLGARWSLMEFYKQAPGFIGGGMDKAYEQADAIGKLESGRGRWARALLLLKEGKTAESLTLYADALTAEPPDYTALYQLGRLAEWSGTDLDHGRQALGKCLTLSPAPGGGDHKEVHVALGHICVKQKDFAAARTAYRTALALDPKCQPALDALAKLN